MSQVIVKIIYFNLFACVRNPEISSIKDYFVPYLWFVYFLQSKKISEQPLSLVIFIFARGCNRKCHTAVYMCSPDPL